MNVSAAVIEDVFKAHERFLWGLCYRMTGNAADADDVVQETFVRALKTPPPRTDEPWRPWLVRVAVNLCRDLLRLRRRRGYDGPWLPSPVELNDEAELPSHDPADLSGNPAARYDLIESVSFAFLLALEALTPAQRAVLLLRDVFDYSVSETANALGLSEANVKTTHHRARRAMQGYDHSRRTITTSLQEQTRQVMEQFLACLFNHDVAGAAALLAEDARHLSDGGGEFVAARVPIVGRDKIVLFNSRVAKLGAGKWRVEWRLMNGLPALVIDLPETVPGYAPRQVTTCELNSEGLISRIYSVVATRKLTAVSPVSS
ncbi:MAG: sigma-70 family RNA polymerase sigma factor [Blastocatellia bacterium]